MLFKLQVITLLTKNSFFVYIIKVWAKTVSLLVIGDQSPTIQALSEELDEKGKEKEKEKEKENENTSFGCHICGEEFKSKGSLRFHMFHHNPKSKNKFQCIG